MVGVAGRSRGCRTCYSRHLKCDETRPYCLRCQKARIHCAGYREQSFISYEAGAEGPQRLSASSHRNTEPAEISLASSKQRISNIDRPLPLVVSDDVCISYARAHLPREWCLDSQWHIDFTEFACETLNIDRYLVQFTLRSLARTLFAYRKQHADLMKEGLCLYRRVLWAVNRALASGDCVYRLDLVESILALRAFDSFLPLNAGAWIHHSRGVESLLALRGVSAHQDPAARRVLENARPLVIMASLAEGKATMLASPEWKVIPWIEKIIVKDSPQYLIDVLADVSTSVHARNQSLDIEISSEANRDQWRQQAMQVLRDLQLWRARWDVEHPLVSTRNYFDCPRDIDIQPFWSQELVFDGTEHAKWTITYDAICMIALASLFGNEIQSMTCDHAESPTKSHATATWTSLDEQELGSSVSAIFHHALLESCQATSHYFQAVREMNHPIDVLIPLRQVWRNTRRIKCPWAAWLDTTMSKIANYGFDGVPLDVEVD